MAYSNEYCHRHGIIPRLMSFTGMTRHFKTGGTVWNHHCPSCGLRRGIVEDFRTYRNRVLFEKF